MITNNNNKNNSLSSSTPNATKDSISFVALGGLDEEGKNSFAIEINDKIFIIECGLKLPTFDMQGVDYIVPSLDYVKQNIDKIQGIIITHGDLNNYGALHYFQNFSKLPIYTTKINAELIKYTYKKIRQEECKFKFITIDPNGSIVINKTHFTFFEMTNSIPQSFGFALHTSFGNIIYTTDSIFSFDEETDYQVNMHKLSLLTQKDKTFLLLADSSNVDKDGYCAPHHHLDHKILRNIDLCFGKVYVSIYENNLYTLTEILQHSIFSGRKVYFVDKEFEKLIRSLGSLTTTLSFPSSLILEEKQLKDTDKVTIFITGSETNLFEKIKQLCNNYNPNINITSKDTFIFAAPSKPLTELLHARTLDTIYLKNCKVINITKKELFSPYAHKEDLKLLLSLVKPQYFIPIKSYYKNLFLAKQIALNMNLNMQPNNILILENGDKISFTNEGLLDSKITKYPTQDIKIDGYNIVEIKDKILNDRNTMSQDGIVVLGLAISLKQKKILSDGDIQMRGCIYLKNNSDTIQNIYKIFKIEVENCIKNNILNEKMNYTVKQELSKYIQKTLEKNPLISINIVNVDTIQD